MRGRESTQWDTLSLILVSYVETKRACGRIVSGGDVLCVLACFLADVVAGRETTREILERYEPNDIRNDAYRSSSHTPSTRWCWELTWSDAVVLMLTTHEPTHRHCYHHHHHHHHHHSRRLWLRHTCRLTGKNKMKNDQDSCDCVPRRERATTSLITAPDDLEEIFVDVDWIFNFYSDFLFSIANTICFSIFLGRRIDQNCRNNVSDFSSGFENFQFCSGGLKKIHSRKFLLGLIEFNFRSQFLFFF